MKLIFLGTGSAFTVGDDNYHSNMLLESKNGKRLLIDCGSDARFSLYEQGYTYHDIHDLYVSHLHADHVGGLEWLAFNTKFDPSGQKIRLHLSETMSDALWEHVLSGGLSSLDGAPEKLSYYFDINEIGSNGSFNWEGVSFDIIQTLHVATEHGTMPSFGLLFEIAQTSVFITTDTQFTPDTLQPYYEKADLIFHDCETAERRSRVHATYGDLLQLDPKIKEKMWLYHYNPGELPDAIADGFKGFVKKGQTFHL